MNSTHPTSLYPAWLGLLALTIPVSGLSQTENLETHLDAVKAVINELDTAAEACVVEQSADQEACQTFTALINGDALSSYLKHCRVLINWRDDLVNATVTSGLPTEHAEETTGLTLEPTVEPTVELTAEHTVGQTAEQTLAQLIDVEYNCGDEALVRHSRYLVSAWDKIRSPSYLGDQPSVRPLRQRQLDDSNYRLRNSLLDGIESQQQRIGRETRELWNRIELENIRQQSRQPIDFGTINR